ncbi:MAG TPA: DUF3488 and transglutaminase-like domain-containing protein [Nevskiaceae bacterium]|nr:DUF3488 and transglutaminase-like domain-containing protein [Nevskiaceae bacterium]
MIGWSKRPRAAAVPLPPHPGVLHLLGVTALVLLPLALHLPWWVGAVAAVAIVWRALVALRGWPAPGVVLRIVLALAAVAGVYAWYGRVNGLIAGGALLAIATALKLTELRSRRDLRILIALLYFTLLVNFLYSQALWTILYLLACTWLITAVLIESNHTVAPLPRRVSLRLAGFVTAEALPLMAVMFVLFPRIPGPLWGMPADAGAAPAGLADSMSPGDIRKLVLSDAVAFRVHFTGPVPPPDERYWRGPVLSEYTGRKWLPGYVPRAAPAYRLEGTPIRYLITLQPSRTRWLFGLDLPNPERTPAGSHWSGDAVLMAAQDNTQLRDYTLESYPRYRLAPRLPQRVRHQDLQLPAGFDPKTRALAHRWLAEGLSPAQMVDAALRMYRDDGFSYTLQPPPLGRNAVDDFLFHTRAGFCEHYAGSFTFLMRAAGIPARVVTGYQGATKNTYGDYYVVRQNDAHAWSEVWMGQRGWVRVDPTAAVSPARVDEGLGAALAGLPGLPSFLQPQWHGSWRHVLRARWDWVNQQWNRFVLGYGPELQKHFLALLGLASWSAMILALTAAVIVVLSALGFTLDHRARRATATDPVQQAWLRAMRKLRHYGLEPRIGESASSFTNRACRTCPVLAPWLRDVQARYVAARYLEATSPGGLQALVRAVRAPMPKDSAP